MREECVVQVYILVEFLARCLECGFRFVLMGVEAAFWYLIGGHPAGGLGWHYIAKKLSIGLLHDNLQVITFIKA